MKNELGIKISVDGKDAAKGLSYVDQELKKLDNNAKKATGLELYADKAREALTELSVRARQLDGLQALETKIEGVSKDLAQAKREVDYFKEGMIKAGSQGAKLFGKDLEAAQKRVASLDTQQQKLNAKLASSQEALRKTGTLTGTTAESQAKLAKETAYVTANLERQRVALGREDVALKKAGASGRKAGADIAAGMKQAETATNRAGTAAGGLTNALRGAAAAFAARGFVTAAKDADTLEKSFTILTGSVERAREEMEFIRDTANELGADVTSAGRAYLSLTAAVQGTSLEGEKSREIFTSVTRAMGRLGKSAAETEGALLAIQQMVSKGTVSSEELRQQLGERLPGAFQVAARAMGLTTKELGKQLELGEILAEDLLPKLAAELNKTYDNGEKVQSFAAAWNRFTNALKLSATTADESAGIIDLLVSGFDKLTNIAKLASTGFITLSERIKATGASLSAFRRLITFQSSWETFKKEVDDAFDLADRRVLEATDKIFNLKDPLKEAGDEGKAAGEKIAEGMNAAKDAAIAAGDEVGYVNDRFVKAKAALEDTGLQGGFFSQLIAELQGLNAEDLPEFSKRMGELQNAGLLSSAMMESLGEMIRAKFAPNVRDAGRAAKESAELYKELSERIDSAPTTPALLSALNALTGAMIDGKIQANDYASAIDDAIKKASSTTGLAAAMSSLREAMASGKISGEQYAAGLGKVSEKTSDLTSATNSATASGWQKILADQQAAMEARGKAEATEEAAQAQAEENRQLDAGASLAAVMAQHMAALRVEMEAISETALAAFDYAIGALGSRIAGSFDQSNSAARSALQSLNKAQNEQAIWTQKIAESEETIDSLNKALRRGYTETGNWFIQTALVAERVKVAYYEQELAASRLLDSLSSLDASNEATLESASRTIDGYKLLDNQTLSKLRSEVDRLKRASDAAADSAEAALRRYQDLIDQQAGNDLAIAEREKADAVADLQEKIAAAREAGNTAIIADLEKALRLAKQYHDEEIRLIRERLEAERAVTAEREAQAGIEPAEPRTAPREPIQTPSPLPTTGPAIAQPTAPTPAGSESFVTLRLERGGELRGQQSDIDAFLEELRQAGMVAQL